MEMKKKKKHLKCKLCGSDKGLVRKYNLCLCRRCFKEVAKKLGFEKYGYH